MGTSTNGSGVRAPSGDVGRTVGGRLGTGARAIAAKLGGRQRTCSAAGKLSLMSSLKLHTSLSLHFTSAPARTST